ncbi:MAG: squalene/phytoene synthase family protein, partial [Alphaproteobacteria bacterium]|nr:squalene/phytoene synthase family protein [Alphaproteobacteria bacterium]
VAGVPGSLTLRIFGCNDENLIENLSSTLGKALQITNILRDVKEDALSGRIYIPAEMLDKAGISSREPEVVLIDKNLAIAREELSQMAEDEYKKAFELIACLPKSSARPIKIIANIYKRYFEIMKNRGWEVISPKPRISRPAKFCIIIKSLFGK